MKLKIIIFVILAFIIATVFSLIEEIPSFRIPFLSITVFDENRSIVGGRPVMCAMMFREQKLGWPFAFFHFVESNACSKEIFIYPVGLSLNILLYSGLIIYFPKIVKNQRR